MILTSHVYLPRFTTHEAQGLTSGKTYSFRVIAENIYGRSDPSVESSGITTQETAKKKGEVKKYEGTVAACFLIVASGIKVERSSRSTTKEDVAHVLRH